MGLNGSRESGRVVSINQGRREGRPEDPESAARLVRETMLGERPLLVVAVDGETVRTVVGGNAIELGAALMHVFLSQRPTGRLLRSVAVAASKVTLESRAKGQS